MNTTTDKVIDHLNEILGSDIKNTEKLQEIYSKLQNEKDSIEKMVSISY